MKKLRLPFSTVPAASNGLLAIAYLVACFSLLMGLQFFLDGSYDINILLSLAGLALAVTGFVLKISGWTAFAFAPICIALACHTHRCVTRRSFCPTRLKRLIILRDAAMGVGLLGTIYAFIRIASEYSADGAGDSIVALSTILLGMGSTLIGIVIALWAFGIHFFVIEEEPPDEHQASTE